MHSSRITAFGTAKPSFSGSVRCILAHSQAFDRFRQTPRRTIQPTPQGLRCSECRPASPSAQQIRGLWAVRIPGGNGQGGAGWRLVGGVFSPDLSPSCPAKPCDNWGRWGGCLLPTGLGILRPAPQRPKLLRQVFGGRLVVAEGRNRPTEGIHS